MKTQYQAHFSHAEDGITVTFPDLPDAITCGNTTEEAIFNAQEVLSLMLQDYLEDNKQIPESKIYKGKNYHWITPDLDIQIALQILYSKNETGISTSDIARTLKTSWASANRIEKVGTNPTIKQLSKTATALGKRVVISFS